MTDQHAESAAGRCCPFETTPGRFNGQWTDCIHGLQGRWHQLAEEMQRIEEQINALHNDGQVGDTDG